MGNMNQLLSELNEIPGRANDFLRLSGTYTLPTGVPYLGMGSSFFAPLAFKYMGVDICPELASEYHHYLQGNYRRKEAVIISQSGRSSEALWCAGLFEEYTAITNDEDSPLSTHPGARKTIPLLAGPEHYSSSKTYINTLLALYRGFGFHPEEYAAGLAGRISDYEALGRRMAETVFNLIRERTIHGIYITGSGPNIATAYEAALILSETTKLCFTGMPMAQYDHGPKETSAGSIVIQILSAGKSKERTINLSGIIQKAGAVVLTVGEADAPEDFSVLHNIIPFNYLAIYLAEMLNITTTFAIGGKVTTSPD
jgi:glutamine---fructose-6-phosphate transaminase (isomerizing)